MSNVCMVCSIDVDECSDDAFCPTNSHCVNTDGDYQCDCDHGYQSNNSSCCEFIGGKP